MTIMIYSIYALAGLIILCLILTVIFAVDIMTSGSAIDHDFI